jgi:hypothetical protein
MAKKLLTAYTFTPSAANAGTVVVAGTYALEQFLLITNVTTGATIYQFNKPSKGGAVATGGGNTTLTLETDTSGMSGSDRLQVFVDDGQDAQVSVSGTVAISNSSVEIANDTGNPIPVGPAATLQVTGSAAANNTDLFSVNCSQYRGINFQITGTWVGTISFQVSNDNTNWVGFSGQSAVAGTNFPATTATNGVFFGLLAGYQFFRLRFTAYTSGTASVLCFLTRESFTPATAVAGGNFLINGNANAPGNLVYTVNSAATTNAASIKATGANLYGLSVMNASATTKYVRLFNRTSAPTVGTDVPIMVVAVPATSSKEIEYVPAVRFGTGLAVAITGGAAATDSTAVAAGDVQLLVSYA